MTEGTRWLFTLLAVVSLLLNVPALLATSRDGLLLAGLAATAVLVSTCCYLYLHGRVPLALDLVDFLAFVMLAQALSNPSVVLSSLFSAVWLRGLYGSTARSVLRVTLYSLTLVTDIVVWPLVHAPDNHVIPLQVLGSVPTLFLTVFIVRQMGKALLSREQAMERDRELAATGSLLIGAVDAAAIGVIGWAGMQNLCAATPGLRVLRAVREGPTLRIDGVSGDFAAAPAYLPATALTVCPDRAEARITDPATLDAAVGAPLAWACLASNVRENGWILVGAPKAVPPEALVSVRALANQVSLALRNSTVQQELTAQASSDPLTGLDNRASFGTKLAAILADTGRSAGLHVLFLDLDDFKDVNDILGHRAGNELLITVAARLRAGTRPGDVCARLGGDEFAVALADTSETVALEIAHRLGEAIAEPVRLDGRAAQVGVSIGVATATPGVGIDDFVHEADVAMYAAKANGKNQVQAFEPGLLRAANPEMTLEWQLAAAAASGELVVYYQPVLTLPGLRCTAVEALVRWEHPERGLLFPGDFIETAERTGAIVGIGAYVLRRACVDAAAWRAANPGLPLAVHVNVSAHELDRESYMDTIMSCLADTGTDPADLVLELTETVVLDSPAAIDRLRAIGALGVQIAIDDFGTGYASLTSLRSLPVDIVKIDMSFVAGALANPFDRSVIEAITRLCAQLGITTVAEGVERPEQQRLLAELGTDAVQGYLYSRPISADRLTGWLRDNIAHSVPATVGG